jgi:predicted component of type VI protein secretion system
MPDERKGGLPWTPTRVLGASGVQGDPAAVVGLFDARAHRRYEFARLTIGGSQKRMFAIGRARYCDILLADPAISAVHCNIVHRDDGAYELCDAESTNGVYVNHILVDRVVLRPGMWIFLGTTELVVIDRDGKIPITAATVSAFLAESARVLGSDRKAAEQVKKSPATVRRARRKRQNSEDRET